MSKQNESADESGCLMHIFQWIFLGSLFVVFAAVLGGVWHPILYLLAAVVLIPVFLIDV